MPSYTKDILDFKVFPEKVKQLLELLQNEQVQSFLRFFMDGAIATSDLKILQRLSAVEAKLGLNELENEPATIPQKLEELETKVNTLTSYKKCNIEEIIQPVTIPRNITDIRADFLIRHLQENEETPKLQSPFVDLKLPFCNSKEFRFFVNNVLPDQYKPKSLKNIRKLKKDVFENAISRYKNLVSIEKSFHGNRELRLALTIELPLPGVTG